MAVNSSTWKKLPIAPRETSFNADEAIARIKQWAAGSVDKFSSAFFWRDSRAAGNNVNSYRLPMGDIVNGKLTLVPHAIFTAAAILSGAHGGLENVVGDAERDQLKRVITGVYEKFQQMWGDRRTVPPWLRGGNEMGKAVAASINNDWGGLPVASVPFNAQAAQSALWQWADGDLRKYRRGFLYWDPANPNTQAAYKLPVAMPIDGTLTIVAAAVNAVSQVLVAAPDSVSIPETEHGSLKAAVESIKGRLEMGDDDTDEAVSAALGVGAQPSPLVFPPASWFANPNLEGPTPIAVTADGRVMGHLASWNTCHAGIGDRCVMAPKSAVGYKFFLNGSVLTADGTQVRVGKITMGTGHADKNLGYVPATDHYDNTGTVVAVVASGEDRHGIWVAGSVVPEADDADVQQLRRSPLSGDWRRINGNLELVAALAVNTPGFPIVSLNASGEPDSLCAAGVILDDGTVANDATEPLPSQDKDQLARVAALQAEWDKIQSNFRKAQLRTVLKKVI